MLLERVTCHLRHPSSIPTNHPPDPLQSPPQKQVPSLTSLDIQSAPLKAVLINSSAVIAVVISGILGFYLSNLYRPKLPHHDHDHDAEIEISTLGQIFGWGCAVLYLGSRIPQVVKNFRRKSTEGLSLLFFLFACLGNITYVLSIVSASLDPRYLLVNLSWLAGSAGTLLLDGLVPTLSRIPYPLPRIPYPCSLPKATCTPTLGCWNVLMVVVYAILHV